MYFYSIPQSMAVQIGLQTFNTSVPPPQLSFHTAPPGAPNNASCQTSQPTIPMDQSISLPPPMLTQSGATRNASGGIMQTGAAGVSLAQFDGRRMRSKAVAVRKTVDFNM